jgi:hypothetical protein
MILKNIFTKKFCKKIGIFDSKQSEIMQKFDHNIVFFAENRRKLWS